jgi:hypothetical protein
VSEVRATALPEGVRQVLIHGLELCGAVLNGDPPDELRSRAEFMRAVAAEHIEIGGDDD